MLKLMGKKILTILLLNCFVYLNLRISSDEEADNFANGIGKRGFSVVLAPGKLTFSSM